MSPTPAVDALQLALIKTLGSPRKGGQRRILVGVSGGADSLALAAVAVRAGFEVYTCTVDHGLQEGSAEVAQWAASVCEGFGASACVVRVEVVPQGEGMEAAARSARYRALDECAHRLGCPLVVAHTRDDLEETLVLGLARMSGPGALKGMKPVSVVPVPGGGVLVRPLLDVGRQVTQAACVELGLRPWEDPHNAQDRFARVRVRKYVLPVLKEQLGQRVGEHVVETSRRVGVVDAAVDAAVDAVCEIPRGPLSVPDVVRWAESVASFGGCAPSSEEFVFEVVCRIVKRWLEADCRVDGRAVTRKHVGAVGALVTAWHGQGPVAIPAAPHPEGGQRILTGAVSRLVVIRRGSSLNVEASTVPRQ